jgi:hypothetical protein
MADMNVYNASCGYESSKKYLRANKVESASWRVAAFQEPQQSNAGSTLTEDP